MSDQVRGQFSEATQLLSSLGDPDWRIRKEAAATAGRRSSDPVVLAGLVEALLQPDDVGLRNAAIEAFAYVGASGAAPLVDALNRATMTARKFVCAALGGTGTGGVAALSMMAGDPDPNTATVALESLARIGGRDAEAALRKQLEAADWVVRLAAMEGLSALGAQVPVETLAPMVRDPLVRRFALRLLGQSGDAAAVPPLFDVLREINGAMEMAEVVRALGSIHQHASGAGPLISSQASSLGDSEKALLRSLIEDERNEDSDIQTARAAAMLLLMARDIEALGAIAVLAARVELGPAALAALQAFGVDAVRPLLSQSQSLTPPARAWAIEAAAELGAISIDDESARSVRDELGHEIRAVLRTALVAHEEVVVHAAARGLEYWAEPDDASALVRLGAERSGAVARATGDALEALSHSSPESVETALDSALPDHAEAWALAVAALPDQAALEKLRAAIASGEPTARRAALLALDRIDGAEAAEVASMALVDEDVDVQVAAVTVLSRMRDPSARETAKNVLRVALRDELPVVRAAAARALGVQGDPGLCADVRELLRDPGPGVALAALVAIRTLRGDQFENEPEFEALLDGVLEHSDEEVVKEALRIAAECALSRKEERLSVGLSHAAWDVRALTVSLLSELDTEGAREKLRARAAIESDDLVRIAIADALATLPSKTIIGGSRR